MRRVPATLAVLAAAALVPSAAEASCARPAPPAERLATSDAAFVGTVLRVEQGVVAFQVERAVKGALGPEVAVVHPALTSVALSLRPGQRTGLFLLRGPGEQLGSNDCLRVGPDDLAAAAVPAPCRSGDRPARRPRRGVSVRVLGCARPPGGRGVQLQAVRRGSTTCLAVAVVPRGATGSCLDARYARRSGLDLDRRGHLLAGTAAPGTEGVVVRYSLPRGGEGRRFAALLPVRGRRTLRRLGLREEVVQWAVDLPRGAAPTRIERHGFAGATVGVLPVAASPRRSR
jgi:hypothetical protein